MNLAWIGLGAIGTPMALNLLKAGYGLTVHNRTPGRCAPLQAAGAAVAPSPAAAARQADALLICVSDDAAAEAVLLGAPDPAGAVAGLRPGCLVIDCSTIGPATSRRLAAALAERQVGYIDAPVTGGTEGAKAGTLSVLVGGDSQHLERARPLLEVIGGRITHFGPVGSGQEAKAVNQVLVAGSYAAVAEALQLAERLGLDRHQVVEALKGGAAGSWALEHRSTQMINDHYPLGFKLALHRKDLGIALEAAAAQHLELPVTEQVAAMEDALLASGHGDLDVSALARWFRS
ncbi:NAD(P)-dependent oxidoreductase [Synechococcus sp. HK05]|uniref:NAD(P)-dependent oxidoreductase n=1 Tax=Synechococcus sp. HK05 TaxID=2725975 RepID=UPI001C38AE1C|nr:NAD(P)-dependent oxidoreductase [Synechococcus sp. HK05]MBV2352446.1 NAD(P)-dependent oxidoreductase [Synechococcus sp. HK05]